MKVGYAIELLQKYYKPEDDIIISWWDKEWVDSLVKPLTNEQWAEVADCVSDNDDNLGDSMMYAIQSAIEYLDTDGKDNA